MEGKKLINVYITFGSDQKHDGCYVLIHAPNEIAARVSMVERYGTKWAFLYNETEWNKPSTQVYLGSYRMLEEWTVDEA